MSKNSDPELLGFAGELIEKRGGLIEILPDRVLAVLPPDLARTLDLPEEAPLGSDDVPLLYGSPCLDRLIALATGEVPVVHGQIEVPYLKKAGFEELLGKDLRFADGQVRVSARAEARTTYMVLTCRYVALSDERKEGLVQIGVHESSGAVIAGLDQVWPSFQPEFYAPGKIPSHFPVRIEQAVSCAMAKARAGIENELADYLRSMRRRLHRDATNTREYYDALKTEMEANLSHPNLTEGQRREREYKIGELPAEMARKVEDLRLKYQVEVTVTACAALRLLVNIARITLAMRFRKRERALRVVWNPLTRRLDPLVCERCQQTIQRIHPVVGDKAIELVCAPCSQKR
jgi:hypothetical protein